MVYGNMDRRGQERGLIDEVADRETETIGQDRECAQGDAGAPVLHGAEKAAREVLSSKL